MRAFDPQRKRSVHRSSRGLLPDQLLDDLVGKREQRRRNVEAERLGGLEKFEFRWPENRQISLSGAL